MADENKQEPMDGEVTGKFEIHAQETNPERGAHLAFKFMAGGCETGKQVLTELDQDMLRKFMGDVCTAIIVLKHVERHIGEEFERRGIGFQAITLRAGADKPTQEELDGFAAAAILDGLGIKVVDLDHE